MGCHHQGRGDPTSITRATHPASRRGSGPTLRRAYPLTGKACVDYVVMALGLLRWDKDHVDEVAPDFTPEGVFALTEMELAAAPNVEPMG